MLSDPVVTCADETIRFEVFSSCCSSYARVDLDSAAFDGEFFSRGTTNVDFSSKMRAALSKIRDNDEVGLSIGADSVEIEANSGSALEKKVKLPLRWLKGFAEVQAYQSRMKPIMKIATTDAIRFLRSIPRKSGSSPVWVTPLGSRGLRIAHQKTTNGIKISGLERLRVLEDIAPYAKGLTIFAEQDGTHASAWVFEFEGARFTLVISPEVWRGFSGEGQVLQSLAEANCEESLSFVRAHLKWQSAIELKPVSKLLSIEESKVIQALSILGTRGLVGYDVQKGAYFHRELPFDMSKVEAMHPRLQAAKRLLSKGAVSIVSRDSNQVEASVASSDVAHRVILRDDDFRCTCPWFSKNQGESGPCKHVLAVQISESGGDERA